jgi:hypothetical protein
MVRDIFFRQFLEERSDVRFDWRQDVEQSLQGKEELLGPPLTKFALHMAKNSIILFESTIKCRESPVGYTAKVI